MYRNEDRGVQQLPQKRHFARLCRNNTKNTRKRINHIGENGETYSDEEEQGKPEEIWQIPHVNRMIPEKKPLRNQDDNQREIPKLYN